MSFRRIVGIELDHREHACRLGVRLPQTLELRHQADELARRQTLEDALLLRDEADSARSAGIGSWIPSQHTHCAPRGLREPGEHAQHRRLAGAVRSEQGGHAGADLEADV